MFSFLIVDEVGSVLQTSSKLCLMKIPKRAKELRNETTYSFYWFIMNIPSIALLIVLTYLSQSYSFLRLALGSFRYLRTHHMRASSEHIEIYTTSGCKYCRIAKAALQELKLDYEDIDVSHADELQSELDARQMERLTFTLTTTVPQIYVGEDHLGGCSDLLDEIKEGKFNKRLEAYGIAPSAAYSTDSGASRSLERSSEQSSGNDFTGSFVPHSGEPLNSHRFLQRNTVHNGIEKLSVDLQRLALSITDDFTDAEGRLIDYQKVLSSPTLAQYVSLSAQLSDPLVIADIAAMSAKSKIAFFCNLYNAFVIHAKCVLPPSDPTPEGRGAFFRGDTGAKYVIGGLLFSLDDIEHGILRCNQPHPSQINAVSFLPTNDPRAALTLPLDDFDPRIHFILNCGAKSCPPIKVLREGALEQALAGAARAYLLGEVSAVEGLICMPRLLLWYGKDFGQNLKEQIERVGEIIGGELGERLRTIVKDYEGEESTADAFTKLLHVTKGEVKVMYNAYDWSLNSI